MVPFLAYTDPRCDVLGGISINRIDLVRHQIDVRLFDTASIARASSAPQLLNGRGLRSHRIAAEELSRLLEKVLIDDVKLFNDTPIAGGGLER